jgi:hypothetical protein
MASIKKLKFFICRILLHAVYTFVTESRSKVTVDSGDSYPHLWLTVIYSSNFKPPTSADTSPSGGSTPTVGEVRVEISHGVGLAVILLCTYEDCFDVSNSFTFLMGQIMCFSLAETLLPLKLDYSH